MDGRDRRWMVRSAAAIYAGAALLTVLAAALRTIHRRSRPSIRRASTGAPATCIPASAHSLVEDCATHHVTSVPSPHKTRGTRPMIEPGQPAPDFTLPDQDGNEVTLFSLRGAPVVVYFYPKADTPSS
jgi:cytochrome oxidase Cu insertion factor (SCO1/SenC/PrrC family)